MRRSDLKRFIAKSPNALLGSFKNPPSGRPIGSDHGSSGDPALQLGQEVTNLHDRVARQNFRVVVIRLEEVERLDLTSLENATRWRWTAADTASTESGQENWSEVQLSP
jgi:pyridoxamine 5'-phosphate oxidase